jgi:hypothetical protein
MQWDGYDNEKDFGYDMYIEDSSIMAEMKDFHYNYFGKGYKPFDFIAYFDDFMALYINKIEECKDEYETIMDRDMDYYIHSIAVYNRELNVYLKGCSKQKESKNPMLDFYY